MEFVKPAMVLPMDEPGEHDILYLSLSLRPEHRHMTMSMYLLSSYLEALTQLAIVRFLSNTSVPIWELHLPRNLTWY